ncbi:type I restriction endonuclease [Helicobacter himalayensis]|uniref:type I restriction endonuclease n=1 Tax=Helicobacter himalayensis TaxID=1591088 RepID=UPI000832B4E8|nr:type I restriction endonuclease [Helicobacter himalayensis]
MDFESAINTIVETISERKSLVKTEEATKMTFVIPFLKALGYDVTNPSIVVPEYTTDVGIKKGEKVDYAIFKDNKPFIMIEAKNHAENLDNHINQLVRYFKTAPSIKFAILTNGIEYRFFTDMEHQNLMDKIPFLVINLENPKARDIKDLERFIYSKLDIDDILRVAKEKKYHREIQEIFKQEINKPSDEFVTFFARRLTKQKMISSTIEKFRKHIKKSLEEFISDTAYEKNVNIKNNLQNPNNNKENGEIKDKKIPLTKEELQGFQIIKSILGNAGVDSSRIDYYKTKARPPYLRVSLQDKWICRLYLFKKQENRIEFPDGTEQKFTHINELYSLREQILKAYKTRNDTL